MCGIAGHISFSKEPDEALVRLMLASIAHRGPDDEGLVRCGAAAILGQRRLSIIDLSSDGHQPMCNEDGTVWITFNGEIYNFLELRTELKKRGHQFRSHTDTETIIHLYEEHGKDCLRFLRGMFAFAIWDEKRKVLFVARDRVGKKPLYYAETPGGFYFASEIQALFGINGYDHSLDHQALDLYITHSYIPSPFSIIKGIKKLSASHSLIYNASGTQVECYWNLSYKSKYNLGYNEARTELMAKVEEATRIRLISDVPLGCFLSGGIDSSIIVAMMARVSSRPVKTFSIGFPDDEYNETQYAARLANYYATEHQEFIVTPDAVEVIPSLVRHFGEPFGDSSALPTWYLSEMTRRHVTVALNGDGGDEMFAGYNWYQTGAMLYRYKRIVPKGVARLAHLLVGNRPQGSLLRKFSRLVELLSKSDASLFSNLRCEIVPDSRCALYHEEFSRHLAQRAEQYLEEQFDSVESEDPLDQMLATDSQTYLPEELLVKVDRMSMAHALEGRSPLLDHKLMEFVARLPSVYKLKNGEAKHILRDMARDLVPAGFFQRPKMGFSVPLKKWFAGDLSGFARDRIMGGPLRELPLFNMTIVDQILKQHGEQNKDFSPLIWRLLMLSEWFSLFEGAVNL